MPWTPNTSQLASNSGCQNGVQSQHTTIQNSQDSIHPILMGAGLGAQYPKNAHLPRGYRMTQIAAAISSKREIGARLLYYGAPLIHCFLLRICGAFVSVHRSCAPRLELPSPFPSLSFPPQRRTLAMALMANKKKASAQGKKSSGCHLLFSSTLDEALSSSDCHVTSRAVMMWLTRCPWINVFLFFP